MDIFILFCVILVFSIFYGLDLLVEEETKRYSYYLKLGSILSIVLSLMAVLMIYMQRKAIVFWEKYHKEQYCYNYFMEMVRNKKPNKTNFKYL